MAAPPRPVRGAAGPLTLITPRHLGGGGGAGRGGDRPLVQSAGQTRSWLPFSEQTYNIAKFPSKRENVTKKMEKFWECCKGEINYAIASSVKFRAGRPGHPSCRVTMLNQALHSGWLAGRRPLAQPRRRAPCAPALLMPRSRAGSAVRASRGKPGPPGHMARRAAEAMSADPWTSPLSSHPEPLFQHFLIYPPLSNTKVVHHSIRNFSRYFNVCAINK